MSDNDLEEWDEDGFYWGTSTYGKDRDRKKKDAEYQIAKAFVKYLKQLILQSSSKKNSIQISKNDLYKDFIYPKIANEVFLTHEKKNFAEYEQGHYLASCKKLISINEEVRPYEYTLLEEDENYFELRPYQKFIIDDATSFKESVLIEAPTGSGKSVMACEIAKKEIEKGGIVLVVAPKIILLDQLLETFSKLEPQIIHGPNDYDETHHIFVSTLQTAHKRDLGFNPTMIIIDEIHYGFSGKMIEQLLEEFEGRLIGLSATPYDQNGALLKGFDNHLNKYNLNYMLENNYLVNPLCYAPVKVDLSAINLIGGDYNQSELDREFNNQENIIKVVLSTKEVVLKQKASLIFCINIAHAEATAQAYIDNGVPARAIHSKLSKNEKDQIMDEYKSGKIKILANPMMLTTGFDYPATDCIILARATQSQNLYRQMVGRGLRLYKDKDFAIILDCSNVIDNLGLPTRPIEIREAKKKIIAVCRECENTTFFRKVKRDNVYKICSNCGDEEQVTQKGIECESCGLFANEKTKYFTKDNSLFMKCYGCNHDTLVGSSSSKDELEAIFDMEFISKIQKDVTLKYFKELIENYNASFPFSPEVSRHIQALQAYIIKSPYDFIGNDYLICYNKDFIKSFEEEGITPYYLRYNDKNKWRLFTYKFEDRILDVNLSVIKEKINNAKYLDDLWNLINQLNQQQNLEALSKELLENLQNDIKSSKLEGIESMVVKRAKQLFLQKEDINNISGFIEMMEQVL